VGLEQRMAGIEGRLRQSDRLIEQLDSLRPRVDRRPAKLRVRQLGSALMYLGGLLVVWVVLLELGLAFGLS
jgi:hypothetical protein